MGTLMTLMPYSVYRLGDNEYGCTGQRVEAQVDVPHGAPSQRVMLHPVPLPSSNNDWPADMSEQGRQMVLAKRPELRWSWIFTVDAARPVRSDAIAERVCATSQWSAMSEQLISHVKELRRSQRTAGTGTRRPYRLALATAAS